MSKWVLVGSGGVVALAFVTIVIFVIVMMSGAMGGMMGGGMMGDTMTVCRDPAEEEEVK